MRNQAQQRTLGGRLEARRIQREQSALCPPHLPARMLPGDYATPERWFCPRCHTAQPAPAVVTA